MIRMKSETIPYNVKQLLESRAIVTSYVFGCKEKSNKGK